MQEGRSLKNGIRQTLDSVGNCYLILIHTRFPRQTSSLIMKTDGKRPRHIVFVSKLNMCQIRCSPCREFIRSSATNFQLSSPVTQDLFRGTATHDLRIFWRRCLPLQPPLESNLCTDSQCTMVHSTE